MSLSRKAPFSVQLDDSISIRLRPLVGTDGDRIKRAYQLLSPESRLNRFWDKHELLSDERAEHLTSTDDRNHFAWIVLHGSDDAFPGYGAASCWRDPEDPQRAEISCTIVDEVQRSGIGTLLLSILWFEAWHLGVREFYGIARRENQALVEWFSSLDAQLTFGSRHIEVALPLTSPEECVDRVQYGLEFGARRIILADWMQDWIAMCREGK
ncbi:MAG: hypothetical protein AAF357_06790 [Verrucomicrobiota bacterium]